MLSKVLAINSWDIPWDTCLAFFSSFPYQFFSALLEKHARSFDCLNERLDTIDSVTKLYLGHTNIGQVKSTFPFFGCNHSWLRDLKKDCLSARHGLMQFPCNNNIANWLIHAFLLFSTVPKTPSSAGNFTNKLESPTSCSQPRVWQRAAEIS